MILKTRVDNTLQYCSGKVVLDIGYAGAEGCCMKNEKSQWNRIKKVASKAYGLDMVCFGEENTFEGDARNFDLGMTFDVITAGEVIEHLDNPGGFLGSCKKHMRNDSLIVMSTPNVHSILTFWYRVIRHPFSPDHVCWYDEHTIRRLFLRHGLEIIRLEKCMDHDNSRLNIFGKIENMKVKLFGGDTLFIVAKLK